jgi:hypothetical protein
MAVKCRKIDHLLPDYLDGVLNDRNRRKVEKHLEACEACRTDLALQREWLELRTASGLHRQTAIIPEVLNERIMRMIRTEKSSQTISRQTLASRLVRWPSLAGMAAAVLILVAAWQVVPQLMLSGRAALPENYTMAGSGPASMTQQQPEGANDTTDLAGQAWQVESQIPADKTVTTGKAALERDCFSQLQEETSNVLSAILAEARDIRYASKGSPVSHVLILADYEPESIENQLDRLKNALNTCENPIQIEIINADEMAVTLDELDQSLYSQFFPNGAPESPWILILIGA